MRSRMVWLTSVPYEDEIRSVEGPGAGGGGPISTFDVSWLLELFE